MMLSAALLSFAMAPKPQEVHIQPVYKTIYEFKMTDIDGKVRSLSEFKGKVLLIVNVASQCGNTPQYAGLETIYEKNSKNGLVVLGFPANDFGQQEPGNSAEIKQFCSENYHVTFPMFEKITVKGPGKHPLYQWLLDHSGDGSEVEWNFGKFLVSRNGTTVQRFSPKTQPDSRSLLDAVRKSIESK